MARVKKGLLTGNIKSVIERHKEQQAPPPPPARISAEPATVYQREQVPPPAYPQMPQAQAPARRPIPVPKNLPRLSLEQTTRLMGACAVGDQHMVDRVLAEAGGEGPAFDPDAYQQQLQEVQRRQMGYGGHPGMNYPGMPQGPNFGPQGGIDRHQAMEQLRHKYGLGRSPGAPRQHMPPMGMDRPIDDLGILDPGTPEQMGGPGMEAFADPLSYAQTIGMDLTGLVPEQQVRQVPRQQAKRRRGRQQPVMDNPYALQAPLPAIDESFEQEYPEDEFEPYPAAPPLDLEESGMEDDCMETARKIMGLALNPLSEEEALGIIRDLINEYAGRAYKAGQDEAMQKLLKRMKDL